MCFVSPLFCQNNTKVIANGTEIFGSTLIYNFGFTKEKNLQSYPSTTLYTGTQTRGRTSEEMIEDQEEERDDDMRLEVEVGKWFLDITVDGKKV